jgi:acyl-CoA reductase-like NAD-dependent aldehyde dehydrogenase
MLKRVKSLFSGLCFARQSCPVPLDHHVLIYIESIINSFLEKIVSKLKPLKVGDPLKKDTDMEAIIKKNSLSSYVLTSKKEKTRLVVMGGFPPGYWLSFHGRNGAFAEGIWRHSYG